MQKLPIFFIITFQLFTLKKLVEKRENKGRLYKIKVSLFVEQNINSLRDF